MHPDDHAMTAEEMVWDLSQLVEKEDEEWVLSQLKAAVREAGAFRDRYRGRITSFSAKDLLDFLVESDDLQLKYDGVFQYCFLTYSADMTKARAQRLFNAAQRTRMQIEKTVSFVDLELGKLLSEQPGLVDDPVLSEYRHYLEGIMRRTPHMLSEKEEQLIVIKDRNGIEAWQQLQGDWLSTRTFEIDVDGEVKTMPYGQIIGLYQSPDRDLRRRTNKVVYEGLGKDQIVWASAIRAVCSDHLEMCRLRKYSDPMEPSLIVNDVERATIDSLMKTIEKNVGLYREYLRLKAKAMGLDRLGNWDIVAPLPTPTEKKFSWSDSRNIIVSAYREFDGEVGEWIDQMYERRHIDGEVRNGKRSGAFCSTWMSGKSAYILQSFNGTMGDVFTQAHELGHAMHAHLGTRAQRPTNYQVGPCIAETGSIFGELLLAEKLLSQAGSEEERRAILASVLDEFGIAAFQVSARVWFEQSLYDAIEAGKYLDGETIAELWCRARDRIYGDAVEWLPEMKWEWTMKVHYYMANFRFYNYPYVYAQLFVYAMYRLYKEQGKEFVPRLKKILAAGSSRSPRELAAEIGFDITKEAFWQKGMDQFAEFIEMFRETL